jgi:type II secretory ATPase GspE/PulE/Tfp pilus assembly ATPase PilB-like protein
MAKSSKPTPQNIELPPIKFEAAGETQEDRDYNLQLVEPSPGFPTVMLMAADVIIRHADTAVFDFTAKAVAIRYLIDGIWHKMPAMERESGDFMLATLKQLCGMNYRERRARQEGSCKVLYFEKKFTFKLVSQGVPTGERVGIYVEWKKPPLEKLDELGMRPKMRDQLVPLLNAQSGLVVVTALPNDGYSTFWRAVQGGCDRFVRDHYVLEPLGRGEQEVINFHPLSYNAEKGQTPQSLLPELLLREPNVLAFSELADGALLNEICRLAKSIPLMTLTRIYSRHAVEALPRLLALKPDAKQLAEMLSAVVSMRLVRKLCQSCKQSYEPSPQLCAKLGLPPQRVQKFYRPLPYQPGQLDPEGNEIPPCDVCQGLGYVGRTGVFELLVMNPALKQALLTNPRVDNLTQVAEDSGHISMRDEAILLVAKGVTSLEEIQRVFAK